MTNAFRKGHLVSTIVLLLSIFGCASTNEADFNPVPLPSKAPANLTWTSETESANIGIGIGIVNPSYETRLDFNHIFKGCGRPVRQLGEETINSLPQALQRDLEKALLAKGFKITGTFPDLESMTYGQKEKSNLVLVPTIVLRPPSSNWNPRPR